MQNLRMLPESHYNVVATRLDYNPLPVKQCNLNTCQDAKLLIPLGIRMLVQKLKK